MSENIDNKSNSEESTVFSAPEEHNDRKSGKWKKPVSIIIGILIAGILCGSIYAIIKVLPDKKGEETFSAKQIIKMETSDINDFSITGKQETLEFYSKEENGNTNWYIKGIEEEKIGLIRSRNFVEAICDISGKAVESGDDSAFGFSDSDCIIKINAKDKKYTLTVGNELSNGSYLKVEGEGAGNYIIDSEKAVAIKKSALDFANADSYKIATFKTDVSAYKDEGGALVKYDSLSLSGKKFNETYTFLMNNEESTKETCSEIMVSPEKHYAQNVSPLKELFTDATGVNGAYSFNDTEEDLKQFGLDNPDFVISLTVGSETKWFKFTEMDDTFCSAVSDDFHMVRKVKKEDLPFIAFSGNDYIYSGLLPFGLNYITEFKCESQDVNTTVTLNNENSKTVIRKDGKEVTSFGDFYSSFISIKPTSFKSSEDFNLFDAKITITLSNGKTVPVLFKKGSGTKYSYKYEENSGEITAASFDKFMKDLNSVK